ncbi:hypothetical protein QN277_024549 [Acacia crassicarpa]|uniref:Uncharacterized protein n=1 Tax=Acacia crassicarpa TaxID=499986 RepID=A0AAE1JCE1_9FABA|nr:hypothetical protein QN277_024549 [Acacia crassicarpa]
MDSDHPNHRHGHSHQKHSSSELLSSAKLFAQAAQSGFRHESNKVDKAHVTDASGDPFSRLLVTTANWKTSPLASTLTRPRITSTSTAAPPTTPSLADIPTIQQPPARMGTGIA